MPISTEPTVTGFMVINPTGEPVDLSGKLKTDISTKKMKLANVSILSQGVAHNKSYQVTVGSVRDSKHGIPVATAAGFSTLPKAPTADELKTILNKGYVCIQVDLIPITGGGILI
jgi:hypothetical protein